MQDISGEVMQDLVFGNDGRLGLRWNLNPKPTRISNWFFFGRVLSSILLISFVWSTVVFFWHIRVASRITLNWCSWKMLIPPLLWETLAGSVAMVWDHRSGKVTEYQTYQSSHVKGAIALCWCQSCCSLSWLLLGEELNLTEILFRSLALVR